MIDIIINFLVGILANLFAMLFGRKEKPTNVTYNINAPNNSGNIEININEN